MVGELIINGKDAFTQWGVVLISGSLGVLMTPASIKPFVENKSRMSHGKQVLTSSAPKLDERSLSVPLGITASSEAAFISNCRGFFTELQKGVVVLYSSQLNETYNLIFEKTQTLTEFDLKIGKIIVQFNEPNPTNRG